MAKGGEKLTKNARQVLKKRYLKRNEKGEVVETPQEMFHRVASAIASAENQYEKSEEEIKKVKGKFLEVMSNLEFMPNSPTLMNAGRELGQLSACFAPDQLIITKSGPKKISEVKKGEKVLTHKDRFCKVIEVFIRDSKEIYAINAYKLPTHTLKVTSEHPILAIKKGDNSPKWNMVKDLSVGDYIGINYPKEVEDVESIKVSDFINMGGLIEKENYIFGRNRDIRTYIRKDGTIWRQNRNRSGEISSQVKPIKDKILVDRDLLKLFGYYLSEGCISKNRCVRFVFSEKERKYGEEVLRIVKQKFGVSSKIEEEKSPKHKWVSIRFHSKILAQFFNLLFGSGFNTKTIPSWILFLPPDKQKGLLAGMFRGDSTTFKNGSNFSTKLVMCNTNLVYSCWQMLMRMGHFSALNFETMPKLGRVQPVRCSVSGKEGTKLINELLESNLPHNNCEYSRYFNHSGRIFTPITEIEKRPYGGKVFNLEVEEDHSYCANMVSVHNCFVLPIEDSMESIFETVKQTSLIHKTGGGTGFSFSRLRPKNSVVKTTGGIASGPVSFMKVFDSATHAVKQGGKRRGANMGILRCDHPDILDFISCKEEDKEINNFNISVAVTDEFMRKVEEDEDYDLVDPHTKKKVDKLNAKEVFDLICNMAWKNGEPGMIFIDRLNEFNPTPQLGEFESTNPCVVGETWISTQNGLEKIEDIYNKYNGHLLDGGAFGMLTDNRAIGEKGVKIRNSTRLYDVGKREIVKLKTKSGYELSSTLDHKIMTTQGWIKVKDLKPGHHKVLIQSQKGSFNQENKLAFSMKKEYLGENGRTYKFNLPDRWNRELGQVIGWIIGDGWLRVGKNCIIGLSFGEEDREILDYLKSIIDYYNGSPVNEFMRENGVYYLMYGSKYLVDFFKKLGIKPWKNSEEKRVPESIFAATEEAVVGFLQGLFSADGTVRDSKKSNSSWIALTSKSEKLLRQIQLLLLNLGIKSRIFDRSRKPRKGMFPYITKNGKKKSYCCDGVLYELAIFGGGREKFKEEIGFLNKSKQKRLENIRFKNYRKQVFEDEIIKIERAGRKKVFDLTEPVTHSMIANGILVHQCGEQNLLPFESCNLGSINLSKMVREEEKKVDWEKLKEVTKTAVHFLDNVIDVNKLPLKEIEKATKRSRKIGLGVMGWADLLTKLEVPYNSEEALDLGEKVMSFILEKATEKSEELASKKGTFPAFENSVYDTPEKPDVRNATLTTIAPTGTISIISGCSSGIEPLFALAYTRHVMDDDKLTEVNPQFKKIAKERGFYSKKLIEKIAEEGSCNGIEEVPEDIKDIFITSHGISPEWHVKMQAAFQKYTNNAVSKTINFPQSATVEDVEDAYLQAFKSNCKGITIYRDKSRSEQVLNIDSEEGKSKPEEKDSKEKKSVKKELFPRPRPKITVGTTTKIATGCGNLYITINEDDKGLPFEVFMQMGKAGGCAASQLEAIARLVSLSLRSNIRLKSIIDQLRGIRCPSPSWEKGSGRIFSCADAIAQVLERRLGREVKDKQLSMDFGLHQNLPEDRVSKSSSFSSDFEEKGHSNVVGVCPDCGSALQHEEGCMKCRSCGYSKC